MISLFTHVARSVSLHASRRPFSRQLSWTGFVNGLAGILFCSRARRRARRRQSETEANYAAAQKAKRTRKGTRSTCNAEMATSGRLAYSKTTAAKTGRTMGR
eukprot:6869498-Pyramimonas_sp.AAC.1